MSENFFIKQGDALKFELNSLDIIKRPLRGTQPHVIEQGVLDGIIESHPEERIEHKQSIEEVDCLLWGCGVPLPQVDSFTLREGLNVFDGLIVCDKADVLFVWRA